MDERASRVGSGGNRMLKRFGLEGVSYRLDDRFRAVQIDRAAATPMESLMEVSPERKLAVVPPPPEDAAWRLLDAVWDVPVGLGLCDRQLSFIRVNEALAGFDGLSVDAHYAEDSLARLPAEFAEGLRQAALGEPHDVEFMSSGRCVLVKLHPVLRPTDRVEIGIGVVAIDVTDKRDAFRAVEEANRLVSELLADANAKEQALSRLIGSVQEGLLVLDPTGRM